MNDYIRTQSETLLIVLVVLRFFDLIDCSWWLVFVVPFAFSLCCGLVAALVKLGLQYYHKELA